MATSFDIQSDTPEMETLAGLAENLVYRLPGCTDLMIRKTLQEVCRDFCRRSCCLRGRRRIQLKVGTDKYAIVPMFGGDVDCVADVYLIGKHRLDCGRHYQVSVPFIEFATYVMAYANDKNQGFVDVVTIEMPSINSEEIPSDLIRRHGEHICSGVLARLMSMTGKAWTDVQQSADERIRYENAVGEARVRHYCGGDTANSSIGFGIDTSELI